MTGSQQIAWKEALQSSPLFSDLSDADLESVLDITNSRRVRKGETLFREGDRVTGFFLVRVGAISVQRTSPGGKVKVIHVFRGGETFAEGALMSQRYPADAVALESTDLLHFSQGGYVKLLETKREFSLRTIVSLSRHMQRLVSQIETHSDIDAPGRVARWLLDRCENPESSNPCRIELKMQKAALADELHMRGETLSRSLKKLSTNGFIEVKGSIVTINNPDQLSAYLLKNRSSMNSACPK